jgi:hypothetical protein
VKIFINAGRYIPCQLEFTLIVADWIWHFVGDHHVVQHTLNAMMELMSQHMVTFLSETHSKPYASIVIYTAHYIRTRKYVQQNRLQSHNKDKEHIPQGDKYRISVLSYVFYYHVFLTRCEQNICIKGASCIHASMYVKRMEKTMERVVKDRYTFLYQYGVGPP